MIFEKLDYENPHHVSRLFKTAETLHYYIESDFLEFEISPSVERWAKDLCEIKNDFLRWFNSEGFVHKDKEEAIEKWNCRNPRIISIRRRLKHRYKVPEVEIEFDEIKNGQVV